MDVRSGSCADALHLLVQWPSPCAHRAAEGCDSRASAGHPWLTTVSSSAPRVRRYTELTAPPASPHHERPPCFLRGPHHSPLQIGRSWPFRGPDPASTARASPG